MTTHHRYPTPLSRQVARAAAATAGALLLAGAATTWGPVVTTGGGLLVAGLATGAVVTRRAAAERMRAHNDQAWPPLPALPDLSVPLSKVLPPPVPRTSSVFTPRESPLMPAAAVAEPEAATVVLSPLPPEYASELAGLPQPPQAEPAPRSVWLRLDEMNEGDYFVLPWSGQTVELRRVDQVDQYVAIGLVLVLVRYEEMELTLQLPPVQRWLMVRALRHAWVRCVVCRKEVEDLRAHVYDLAALEVSVLAMCAQCASNTGGPA